MSVKDGDTIKVEYTGTLEDGTVFDSSEKQGKLLEFKVGDGKIIKGFDDAVKGMEKDEEKEFSLKPEEAYGEKNPNAVQKVPKDKFPQDKEVQKGMMVIMGTPEGQQVPAVVLEVDDNEVTLDLNHPLAGKTLNFKIKVKEIASGSEQAEASA